MGFHKKLQVSLIHTYTIITQQASTFLFTFIHYYQQPPQYPPPPTPHPQQLTGPTPIPLSDKPTTDPNPSPKTSPDANIIKPVCPNTPLFLLSLVLALLLDTTYPTIPPINRAIENWGVFTNPIANGILYFKKFNSNYY